MKQVDHTIKDGDAGIRQTVQEMCRLASRDASNPKIVATARSLRGKNEVSSIKNIYEYVYKNYPYKSDPSDREVVSAPVQLYKCATNDEKCELPSWAGLDCDDLTVLLCALYKAAGFKPLIKIIDWKPDNSGFTHVYPMVLIPGDEVYIPTDAVAKAKGFAWEKSPVNRYEIYDLNGSKVASGKGSGGKGGGKSDSLMGTTDHNTAGGIKAWWQVIEDHAALIGATTAVVSIGWAIYISSAHSRRPTAVSGLKDGADQKVTWKLRGASSTKEGIVKILNDRHYSTTFEVDEDGAVRNKNGKLDHFRVVHKKGRYRLEEKQ